MHDTDLKKPKFAICAMSIFIACLAMPSFSQEKVEIKQTTDATKRNEVSSNTKDEAKKGVTVKENKSLPAAKPNSSERFVPTEQISEDLAVSFPVDI